MNTKAKPEILHEVILQRENIELWTQLENYRFDLSKIPDDEYQDIITVLTRMNFDNSFKLQIKSKKKNLDIYKNYTAPCSWCKGIMHSEQKAFCVTGKKLPGKDISMYEGQYVPLEVTSREETVMALVTASDSDARKEGIDFLFVVCSMECANELLKALKQDEDILELINSRSLELN